MADLREKIIASLFSRRNASGQLEESYVSHIKVWEEAEGERKPRYILLSQAISGSGFIHKSKLNTNGTFSVGKTWRLVKLRALNVISPLAFDITLSKKTYRWQTENKVDQVVFLESLVRLFRTVTNGQPEVSLHLNGVQDYDTFPDKFLGYSVNPTSDVSSADIQIVPRDFDSSTQATVDRLIVDASETELDGEGEEESAQEILANVEEMMEGYEWVSENVIDRILTNGAVDLIEAKLLDEIMALEKANIHSFLESDDRLALVMKCIDEAISEIDNLESLISTNKILLNTVNDDILYIQSQKRGLVVQAQAQNQRALLGELQNLLISRFGSGGRPSAISSIPQMLSS